MRKAKGIAVCVVTILLLGCGKERALDLKNKSQRQSYAIGQSIGGNIKAQNIDVNDEALIKGLSDALKGKSELSTENMQTSITEFQKEQQEKQEQTMKGLAEKNLKNANTFLEVNKKKSGVKTTASGLQYKVVKEGTGKRSPSESDMVTVHYAGTLINGTEFDSSIKRGTPATFQVSGVIKGWTEALQLMKVGDKFQLFIPPQLAYGERGAGGLIEPNAALIFDVELLDIKSGK